jgi:hypothetical protein
MKNQNLLNNRGNVEDVKCAVKLCENRKDLRLALQNERENKNRKSVIDLLEKKLKA